MPINNISNRGTDTIQYSSTVEQVVAKNNSFLGKIVQFIRDKTGADLGLRAQNNRLRDELFNDLSASVGGAIAEATLNRAFDSAIPVSRDTLHILSTRAAQNYNNAVTTIKNHPVLKEYLPGGAEFTKDEAKILSQEDRDRYTATFISTLTSNLKTQPSFLHLNQFGDNNPLAGVEPREKLFKASDDSGSGFKSDFDELARTLPNIALEASKQAAEISRLKGANAFTPPGVIVQYEQFNDDFAAQNRVPGKLNEHFSYSPNGNTFIQFTNKSLEAARPDFDNTPDKIHISVHPDDFSRAWDVLQPLLLSKDSPFVEFKYTDLHKGRSDARVAKKPALIKSEAEKLIRAGKLEGPIDGPKAQAWIAETLKGTLYLHDRVRIGNQLTLYASGTRAEDFIDYNGRTRQGFDVSETAQPQAAFAKLLSDTLRAAQIRPGIHAARQEILDPYVSYRNELVDRGQDSSSALNEKEQAFVDDAPYYQALKSTFQTPNSAVPQANQIIRP